MITQTIALVFTSLLLLVAFNAQAEVVIYPAPEGEKLSSDFEVTVNGRQLPVYFKADRNEQAYQQDSQRFGRGGGNYSFAYFDFDGTAEIRVTSSQFEGEVVVRPRSKGVEALKLDARSVGFTLTKPAKLSIEGKEPKNGLILIARSIEEKPINREDPNLIYFGPGIHRPGVIQLRDNQTLYVAGGAIVKAGIVARGDKITIRGRGILDGSGFKWPSNPAGERGLINFIECNGVRMQDLIVRDSPCWTIVPMHSRNILIEGVTLCNSSNENDDGIDPCNTQRLIIRDCFIRTDDDCIAIKGWSPLRGRNMNVEKILIEDSTFWCDRARIFLLGHESQARHMRSITVRNCDIIHFAMTPFLVEPADEMKISRVLFSNIRVHGEGQRELIRLKPVELPQYNIPGFGYIDGVSFDRIVVEGQGGAYQVQLFGVNKKYQVGNVSFRGVLIKGNNLAKNQSYLKQNEYLRNLRLDP